MTQIKQVDSSHYDFHRYMAKPRWNSVWHQIDEVAKQEPSSVLEIGPGPGTFKLLMSLVNIKVETLDLDPELGPDHVGSAIKLPFPDNSYEVVCAFQMLEHLPYDDSLLAFSEIVRVAQKSVVISLPDAKPAWPYSIHVPRFGILKRLFPKPFARPKPHVFDGEHYWELNKAGYPLSKVISDLSSDATLLKTYRVFENHYHRFFVFSV